MKTLNLPNSITLARIAMIPLFVLLALWRFPGHDILAALIFSIAAISDFFDGYFARKHNLVSTLGKFLDPLADKLLVCSAFITLVALGRIPAWVVVVIICREFAVNGMRILAADAGVVIAASNLGKLKTTVQMITILLLLVGGLQFWPQPFFTILSQVFIWLTLLITVISGADYILQGRRFIK